MRRNVNPAATQMGQNRGKIGVLSALGLHAMGASRAAGARKMLFFLQRDSHSAGCTRQTPPNRVSADSPSRILPGDVLVSLRFPLPKKLQRCEWPSGNSRIYFWKYFFGPIKKKGGGGTTCLQGVIGGFGGRKNKNWTDRQEVILCYYETKKYAQPSSTFCCTPLVWLVVTLPGSLTPPSRRGSAR